MDKDAIERLIDAKILAHERRIGWISGIAGVLFMGALFLLQ
jgi:hypothetical protein